MRFRTHRSDGAQDAPAGPSDREIDELGPRLAPVARWLVGRGRTLDLWGERRTHGYPPPYAVVDGVLDRAAVEEALDLPAGVEWRFREDSGWSMLDADSGAAILGSTPGPGAAG